MSRIRSRFHLKAPADHRYRTGTNQGARLESFPDESSTLTSGFDVGPGDKEEGQVGRGPRWSITCWLASAAAWVGSGWSDRPAP